LFLGLLWQVLEYLLALEDERYKKITLVVVNLFEVAEIIQFLDKCVQLQIELEASLHHHLGRLKALDENYQLSFLSQLAKRC
jgi:hypothetical protein